MLQLLELLEFSPGLSHSPKMSLNQEYKRIQKYRGPLHCFQTSWRHEGPSFLFRGIGSTFFRVFSVTAVSFGTYSFIMKKWGSEQFEDTYVDLMDSRSEKLAEENTLSSTFATDGPDIIAVQETLISDEYRISRKRSHISIR
jgi:hypothetical protein